MNGKPEVKLPEWAEGIRSSFRSSAAVQFLLHGMGDLVPFGDSYLPVRQFIYRAFGGGKTVVFYNISEGFTFPTPEHEQEFHRFLDVLRSAQPRFANVADQLGSPEPAIRVLEQFLMTRNNVVAVLDYVDKLVPQKEGRFLTLEEKRIVTALHRWASDPRLLRRNNAVFLITETLSEVDDELYTGTSRVELVEIPLPDEAERLKYINYLLTAPAAEFPRPAVPALEAAPAQASPVQLGVKPAVLAKLTNGLSYVQIANILRRAREEGRPVDHSLVSRWKRRAIEAELGDLVEFVEPRYGLEALAGMERQKKLLLNVARAMREGRTSVVPKGIMLLGPPGCGKTFCMECFAHDCGIPFLRLGNVFSKYVGSTEANLEKLFYYLEALSPVFVFMDEFDQSYGRRVTSDSDSGVSRRVFAMFNTYLSDESRQGKVLFGAATNRPDLIDPSTLRAGRFDLKLPFFLPDAKTREAILRVTFQNEGLTHEVEDFREAVRRTEGYSGADLKEIVLQAHRFAAYSGRKTITQRDFQRALEDYIAPVHADPDMIRYMELLAVAGTTSRSLLTPAHCKATDSGQLHQELDRLRSRLAMREGWTG